MPRATPMASSYLRLPQRSSQHQTVVLISSAVRGTAEPFGK
ncbi:MAG TPA: hypothetical protein VIK78_12420 [Ruminiclostridium sp.]